MVWKLNQPKRERTCSPSLLALDFPPGFILDNIGLPLVPLSKRMGPGHNAVVEYAPQGEYINRLRASGRRRPRTAADRGPRGRNRRPLPPFQAHTVCYHLGGLPPYAAHMPPCRRRCLSIGRASTRQGVATPKSLIPPPWCSAVR